MNAEMNFDMNAEINVDRNADRNSDMNMGMKFSKEQKKEMGIAENCNVSMYSLITFAGGFLLAVGAVVYSLIAM